MKMHFGRRLAALGVLGLASGLVVSGCGGQQKFAGTDKPVSSGNNRDQGVADAQDSAVEEPESKLGKYGGTMVDASISDPKTLNLWSAAETSSTAAVGPLFDALIARNYYTLEWEDRLAELPEVSEDGRTWTFKLKDGLKWSDGRPITADDVIFTLDVIYDERIQTNFRESMKVDVPDPAKPGEFKRVPIDYRKVDDRTIEFKFPVAYAPARDILSFSIAPKHVLEGPYKAGRFNSTWGVNTNVKNIVSSGPWILTEYKPGQRLVYGRNPNYWRKDAEGRPLPYLDRLVTLIVPDVNTTTLKFLAGETDVLDVSQSDYKTVKAQEGKGNFQVLNLGPTTSTNYLSFNLNMRSKPAKENPELFKVFNEQKFRQAVSHAIDREKIARNVFDGLAQPGFGPESPANKAFYYADTPKFEFDIQKSKQLLSELGLRDSNGDGILELKNGKPIKFSILTNTENNLRKGIATVVTADLRRIGLDATFTPVSFNTLVQKLDAKPEPGGPYPPYDWQAIILGFTGGVEPNDGTGIWKSSGNLHQWEPYQEKPVRPWEAEIDRLFREGAQELDETKRREIYNDWQRIVGEQQPLIYTVVPDALVALRNKYENIKPASIGGLTWNLYEIYAKDATRDTP